MAKIAPAALAALMFVASIPLARADDTTRELPPGAQEMVEQVAQQLTRVQDPDAELSCDKAVENAHYGIDTMLEVGQRNLDTGYLKRADYEASAAKLKAFRAQVTDQDCRTSSGPQREFYRCMSSDYNHVVACAAQVKRSL